MEYYTVNKYTLRSSVYLHTIQVFSSSSWKSLFYHCEIYLRPEQSGQLANRVGPEFLFTVHSVGTSCKSLKHWYIFIFYLLGVTIQKHWAVVQDQWMMFLTSLSATLKQASQRTHTTLHDSAEISISLDIWKWSVMKMLSAKCWIVTLDCSSQPRTPNAGEFGEREQWPSFRESAHLHTSSNAECIIFSYPLNTQG